MEPTVEQLRARREILERIDRESAEDKIRAQDVLAVYRRSTVGDDLVEHARLCIAASEALQCRIAVIDRECLSQLADNAKSDSILSAHELRERLNNHVRDDTIDTNGLMQNKCTCESEHRTEKRTCLTCHVRHLVATGVYCTQETQAAPDPRLHAAAALQHRLETAYRHRLRPATLVVPGRGSKPAIPPLHAVTFTVVPDYAGTGLVVRGCPPDLFDRLPQRWAVDETSPRYDVRYLEQA